RYDPASLLAAAQAAQDIPYEQAPSGTSPQRRLLKRDRTVYRSDDLSGQLHTGQVDSLALVDATCRLVYTPGLLSQTYETKITATALGAELTSPGPGAYVDLDGDGCLWAPSARAFYSADPGHPDPVFAAQHFYLPQNVLDPWGNPATVGYDAHDL